MTEKKLSQVPSTMEIKPEEAKALAFLLPLSREYPDIEIWYQNKVLPGLRAGTRKLVCIERDGQIVGLGIGKNEDNERKICTVRVAPSHMGKGMGLRIFDMMLHWLNTDQPHLTVSDKKLPLFERVFDYYGFTMTSKKKGLYIPGEAEIYYNEILNSKKP